MPRTTRRSLVTAGLVVACGTAPLHASGFTLFQHGGRGAAQAGALVARADEPSALRYNPAGLVGLDSFQLQAGLDFTVSDVELSAPGDGGGNAQAIHEIQFPPALYLSWKRAPEARWALGFGVDSPFWSLLEWPGTNALAHSALKSEVTLLEGRAGAAFALTDRWSVGGATRWVTGSREQAAIDGFVYEAPDGATTPIALRQDADSTVDGAGFELALRYAAPSWGTGLVWTSGIELEGDGDASFEALDVATGALPGLATQFAPFGIRHELELPEQVTAGLWFAAGERTHLELDVELARWSAADGLRAIDAASGDEIARLTPERDWSDTVGVRVALEHRHRSGWRLGAGLAWQESPVPDSTRGFDFPYGDARVAALGASYDFPGLSFDLGWSYHESAEADADRFATDAGTSSFVATAQVFSVSARWRFGEEVPASD